MTIGTRMRAEGLTAPERRLSRAIVAPYISSVNVWQKQLIKLRALRNSERSTPQQRTMASNELADLLASGISLHTRFDAATLGDRSSRKLDLGRSLRRLAEMARSAGSYEPHD